jgi:predicted transcriptional regulator of viral defense system
MKSYLKELVISSQTVFTLKDLGEIWKIENPAYLKVVLSRLNKRQEITRLQRGIYVISQNYDKFELANKLKAPSYVSLETVLQKENIVFQKYDQSIFSVSDNTLTKKVDGIKFEYSKIATEILSDPIGIEIQSGAFVASLERAVCDRIYLSPNYYFDNLRPINLQKMERISQIYNKRVQKEVKKIIKEKYA